ncbi:hypothetical protein MRX96_043110 [Rhipicephalus microplus]
MGDFNGHLQALDGFQDTNGELLLALARTLALDVLNLRPESRRLTHMNIDEKGEFSIGSGHNRIKLSFSRSSWRTIAKEHRNPAERHLPQSEYAAVAEAFEQNFQPTEPPTYDQFVLELRRIMKKHEVRVNSRGGLRRKGWWDEEVQRALIARRTANCLHRVAVRTSPG